MAKSEDKVKSLLMKLKEESEKAGWKLNFQEMKIMTSGPTTSWQMDGETMIGFGLLGSQLTVGLDYSHDIKRLSLLGKKSDKYKQHLRSTDITLPTNVHLSQIYGVSSSPVWMWDFDHKVEHWRTGSFKLWYWRELLRVLHCMEIKSVNPKGNSSWVFIARTGVEAEISIF